ncbi:prohibitin family protein [Candidatus Uhrbacteria bacterium]|nr:prohibitin family protein [Candidatus Uhrbacteria bacterium]
MPPFLEWLRRQQPQRLFTIAIVVFVAFSVLGRFLIPVLLVGGVCYLLFRQWSGSSASNGPDARAGAGRSRVISSSGSSIFFTAMRSKVPWIVFAVVVLLILASGVVVIGAGQTGVVHLFGKVRPTELRSGFHLVNPLARVERMSIRTEEFSMTKTREGGQGDTLTVLTKEGLNVALDLTVLYRLQEEKASDIFREVGPTYRDRIILPIIRSAIRATIAEFEAKDVYSAKREEVAVKLRELISKDLEPRGITLEEVLLRDVSLPERLTQSIQEKLTAEQEAQRYEFTLQTAKKEAERKRIEAEGQRDAQRIITTSLTPEYLHFKYIESLKDRPGTIYVPTNPANGLPLFQNIGR